MTREHATGPRAEQLREEIRLRYRGVADRPEGRFAYPVGRASAVGLGYEPDWLEAVPPEVTERFVGVGNPFRLHRPAEGERVLDVGCGCGLDSFVAATLAGPRGRVVGLDLTHAMLAVARQSLATWQGGNLSFVEGSVTELPFESSTFDVVLSNGVLNLAPDKDAAFGELARVLRPGGRFAVADLLVDEAIPEDVLAQKGAWST